MSRVVHEFSFFWKLQNISKTQLVCCGKKISCKHYLTILVIVFSWSSTTSCRVSLSFLFWRSRGKCACMFLWIAVELSETVNSMVMHFSCGSIFSLVVFLAVTGIVGILLFLLLLSSSNHRLKLPWLILQARKSRPNVKTRCRCLETTQPTIGGIPVQVLIIFFSSFLFHLLWRVFFDREERKRSFSSSSLKGRLIHLFW